jgi:hypothetical protein
MRRRAARVLTEPLSFGAPMRCCARLALGRGLLLWLGAVGAACFLVAISWLGVGAAFPTNLVLAAGVVLLLRAQRPRRSR